MNKILLSLSLVLGFGLILATPAWADFQAGVNAYERGDYETALAEFRPLAEQGDGDAQFNLGAMYFYSQGVPQDYVFAHMWANLAASQGSEDAVEKRDAIATKMTPQQIAEAQRLAREWKAKGK